MNIGKDIYENIFENKTGFGKINFIKLWKRKIIQISFQIFNSVVCFLINTLFHNMKRNQVKGSFLYCSRKCNKNQLRHCDMIALEKMKAYRFQEKMTYRSCHGDAHQMKTYYSSTHEV